MKSSRRHELKSNELAETLEQVKSYVFGHGSRIVAVALLVVVVILVGVYLRNSRRNAIREGWQQVYTALGGSQVLNEKDLEAVAADASDPVLAAMALKTLGDKLLDKWIDADESTRQDLAERIRGVYNQLLDKYGDNTMASAGAHMGLGILAENLGQWDEAEDHYKHLISEEKFASTPFAMLANIRTTQLQQWSKPVVFASTQPASTQAGPLLLK